MNFIGCDPKVTATVFAGVTETGLLRDIRIVMAKSVPEMMGRFGHAARSGLGDNEPSAAFAVEGQEIYYHGPGKTSNPTDLLHLGQVAGAAYCMLAAVCGGPGYFPTPVQWKGTIPKHVHHGRILSRAGIADKDIVKMGGKDPYLAVVSGIWAKGTNKSDWKDICDAIGLAQYAADRYLAETTKQAALATAR